MPVTSAGLRPEFKEVTEAAFRVFTRKSVRSILACKIWHYSLSSAINYCTNEKELLNIKQL